MKEKLKAMLVLHEGEVLHTYFCPAGKLTIGVGHNLEANPIPGIEKGDTITHERAMGILDIDITECVAGLKKQIPWTDTLDEVRKAVLIDMCFNLGLWGLLKFKNTLAVIKAGDYADASEMMLQSKWAGQVGERADRLSRMMKTGEWA